MMEHILSTIYFSLGTGRALSPNPVRVSGAKSALDHEVNGAHRHDHKPDELGTNKIDYS